MSVKSNYFKMGKEEFNEYLNNLKKENNSIHLLNNNFYYNNCYNSNNMILVLNNKITEFNFLIESFSQFVKHQIVQSFLIEEIEATNKIENIYSTRHDIFKIINDVSSSKDKKIISIANAYKHLLENGGYQIFSNSNVRNLYDEVLKGSIEKDDLPDGLYYRINSVYTTNGLNLIHTGVIGEENINKMMEEFIRLYNSNIEVLTKMILCHVMFEYIHPFYDGNGRLGRFLMSNGLFLENKKYFSLIISLALEYEKEKYYKAFKEANDKYEFGFLNTYVETVCSILINQVDILIKKINLDKEKLLNYKTNIKMTKSEKKIYSLLSEASIFSNYGVSSIEILKETNVSKRTLIYSLNKFREYKILNETKIGRNSYFKLVENKELI